MEIERQMMVIKSSLEKADKLMIRDTNGEVVQLMKSFEKIFQRDDQDQLVDLELKKSPFLTFEKNQRLLNTVEGKGIGCL